MIARISRATLAALAVWSLCTPASAQPASGAATIDRRSGTEQTVRVGYNGLYPGMPVTDLPDSLKPTASMGEREGFVGPDFIQVQTVGDSVTQLAVVYYYVPPSGSQPVVDRKLSLADAWRIHGVPAKPPEFALYMAYLQKIEGLIDTRNMIAYRLKFPKTEFDRNSPALFDPATRVERVVYAKDRVEFAFNHQPISSRALLDAIARQYRAAVGE